MTSSSPENLGGVAEISEMLNVPRTTVSMWDARRATSGFPVPVQRFQMGPVYDLDVVQTWYDEKYATTSSTEES